MVKSQGRDLKWRKEKHCSFEKLKVSLATTQILAIVDPHKPFVLDTNASNRSIGVVLLQDGRLVAYESKKLDRAHQNYFAYEHELYAIILALKQWHHYLYGEQFAIVCDHESIKRFPNKMDLKGRKAKWIEILQEYDCQLQYHKGWYKVVADVLSRMPEINSLSFTELKSKFLEYL